MKRIVILFFVLISLANGMPAFITHENDVMFDKDEYYTEGLQFTFFKNDYSFGVGEQAFTPKNVKSTNLIENDRRYAGYSFLFFNKNTEDSAIGATLGLTGDISEADWVQLKFHELIDVNTVKGWHNQMPNKVLFMLNAMKEWEVYKTDNFAIIPNIFVNVGTPITRAIPSIEFRVGKNVDTTNINKINYPSLYKKIADYGYYFYVKAESDVILYNLFLTKSDIKKNPVIYELNCGVVINYNKWYLKIYNMILTKEYKEQTKGQRISGANIGYLF
ncbi:MAG: hypothetical protein Ta2D_00210 [Rickettsiales bacterium]|nr:MAG: hypothetical protein Ta2D_00210 [Rickettsiales bacterium]